MATIRNDGLTADHIKSIIQLHETLEKMYTNKEIFPIAFANSLTDYMQYIAQSGEISYTVAAIYTDMILGTVQRGTFKTEGIQILKTYNSIP